MAQRAGGELQHGRAVHHRQARPDSQQQRRHSLLLRIQRVRIRDFNAGITNTAGSSSTACRRAASSTCAWPTRRSVTMLRATAIMFTPAGRRVPYAFLQAVANEFDPYAELARGMLCSPRISLGQAENCVPLAFDAEFKPVLVRLQARARPSPSPSCHVAGAVQCQGRCHRAGPAAAVRGGGPCAPQSRCGVLAASMHTIQRAACMVIDCRAGPGARGAHRHAGRQVRGAGRAGVPAWMAVFTERHRRCCSGARRRASSGGCGARRGSCASSPPSSCSSSPRSSPRACTSSSAEDLLLQFGRFSAGCKNLSI